MRYGLLGARLSHSYSEAVHALLVPYAYRYELFERAPHEVERFLRGGGLKGLNVTIPYKRAVMGYCDALSEEARAIGSVNTLLFDEMGRITGHNTDAYGFGRMLEGARIDPLDKKVLILGAGGTAHTVRAVVRELGAREIAMLNHAETESAEAIGRHLDAELLVNATPVGMYPDIAGQAVSLTRFSRLLGVVDCVYNPLRTRLLMQAAQMGIPAVGGLSMLVYQAARAAELFLGQPMGDKEEGALAALRARVENIVLIGMPGCGKSSVGAALAALTGRALIDTDDIIRERSGKDISHIFMEDGEAAFRALERRAVQEAAGHSGVLIATGGGAILSEENRMALRQNGRVYHITRPREQLETAGRPLSGDLARLESERMPLYRAACDVTVPGSAPAAQVARDIWEDFIR